MIAAIGDCGQVGGIFCVAGGGVEVNYGVELAAGANPSVDLLAEDVSLREVIVGAFKRENGNGVNADVMGVGPCDDLLVGGDHVFRGRRQLRGAGRPR